MELILLFVFLLAFGYGVSLIVYAIKDEKDAKKQLEKENEYLEKQLKKEKKSKKVK